MKRPEIPQENVDQLELHRLGFEPGAVLIDTLLTFRTRRLREKLQGIKIFLF